MIVCWSKTLEKFVQVVQVDPFTKENTFHLVKFSLNLLTKLFQTDRLFQIDRKLKVSTTIRLFQTKLCFAQVHFTEQLNVFQDTSNFHFHEVLSYPNDFICPDVDLDSILIFNGEADTNSTLQCEYGKEKLKLGEGFKYGKKTEISSCMFCLLWLLVKKFC